MRNIRSFLMVAMLLFFVVSISARIRTCSQEHPLSEEINNEEIVTDTIEQAPAFDYDSEDYTDCVIYDSGAAAFLCDGRYVNDSGNADANYFTTDLDGLNRQHFSISFDFIPQSADCILMLSGSCRLLGVHAKEDGRIYISTNNHDDHHYLTNTGCKPNQLTHIEITVENGEMLVNGERFSVDFVSECDDTLSSCDYSVGEAFKGILKNIVVKSYR